MDGASTHWFSPTPSEISPSRVLLDFNLRAADLYFRELVVPELGRVWFARQLSWPLAALALHKELGDHSSNAVRPTTICHGIEALACKVQFLESESASERILGRRAFSRDEKQEVWSFRRLQLTTNYVQNTHRQAATRAIRVEGGLGFARGSRFDLMALECPGGELANAFLEQRIGRGGMSLRKWLIGWLKGNSEVGSWSKTLIQALSPEYNTEKERACIHSRLLKTSTPGSQKRERLARAIGRAVNLPDIDDVVAFRLYECGHFQQAYEILAARAFGAMLDRARDAIAHVTHAVEPERRGVKLAALANHSALQKSIRNLRTAVANYREKANTAAVNESTSLSFANAIETGDNPHVIRLLVGRARNLLVFADERIVRGSIFQVIEGSNQIGELEDSAESLEPDRTGRTFRIANLHTLLRDISHSGTP